jgi:putative pyruvate formate lyase activating enzyme
MLDDYFKIIAGKKKARYLKTDFKPLIDWGEKQMLKCGLCERKCNAKRSEGKTGWCNVLDTRVASEFLHLGEEPELIPSHTVFFSGCNFECVYCQNWDISQRRGGWKIKLKSLAETIKIKQGQGAKNLNLVGGEPTPNLPYILKVLKEMKRLEVNTPIIWNSNMYMSAETMRVLNKVVDVYLGDFKYGKNECAERLSKVPKYWGTVTRNYKKAKADLLIRHLVLPGHVRCCSKPLIKWIAENLSTDIYLNVMDQYRPEYHAHQYKEINRQLSTKEYEEVLAFAQSQGFKR